MTTKRLERLVNLCAYLLRPGGGASAEEIRRAIPQYARLAGEESFRKALQRDLRALRDLGVPVEVNAQDEYSISGREYMLPVVGFSAEELYWLAMGCKAAQALTGPIATYADSAWRKLTFDQTAEVRGVTEQTERVTFHPSPIAPRLDRHDLELLFECLLFRKTMLLRCAGEGRGMREERLDPYALATYDGQWYLLGFFHRTGEVRALPCARIESVARATATRPEEPDFHVPQDFEVRKYLGPSAWRRDAGEQGIPVRVRFAPEVWWWVQRNWAPLEQVEHLPNGGGTCRMRVGDAERFLSAVLEFGAKAEVLDSPLREAARAALRRVVEAHQ